MPTDKFPNPDYDNHPAYGKLFGRPKIRTQIRALRRWWPYFKAQAALSRSQKNSVHRLNGLSGATGSPLFTVLNRDGAAGVHLSADEKKRIVELMNPSVKELEAKLEQIPTDKRTFADHLSAITREKSPGVYQYLCELLETHGVLAAASQYLNVRVDLQHVVLQINDTTDTHLKRQFLDAGVPDPSTTYMHIDSTMGIVKSMVYLNSVTKTTGPFSYVIGSNNFKMSWLEYVTRKANDTSRFDKCDRANRELFFALPKPLRKKSEFGNDLLDSSSETKELLAREHQFTSEDGDIILFDNDGIHRGSMVREGKRQALQLLIGPA